jgi:hypothetical protein
VLAAGLAAGILPSVAPAGLAGCYIEEPADAAEGGQWDFSSEEQSGHILTIL